MADDARRNDESVDRSHGSPLGTDPQEEPPIPADPREAREPREPRTSHAGPARPGRESAPTGDERDDRSFADQIREAWDRMRGSR